MGNVKFKNLLREIVHYGGSKAQSAPIKGDLRPILSAMVFGSFL